MTDTSLAWRCARCDKAQEFIVDKPCECGCRWLKTDTGQKHVGGPDWPAV